MLFANRYCFSYLSSALIFLSLHKMHINNFDITTQSPYFSILRAAIWNTDVDVSDWPDKIEWCAIIDNYRTQALLPLVSSVLCSLPEKYKLPETYEEEILTFSSLTIQTNYRIKAVIAKIFASLKECKCTPILLKGETIAKLYPNPNLRACGDIDILVHPDQYRTAIRNVQDLCGDLGEEDFLGRHHKLRYDDLVIEIHQRPGFCANLWHEKKYQNLAAIYYDESIRSTAMDGICELVPQFNFWYVFNHLMHHFHDGGVGLRQFVDWMLVVNDAVENKSVDLDRLEFDLKTVGLLRPWRIFSHLLVEYLGLPKGKMPLFRNVPKEKLIFERYLTILIASGNFGHGIEKKARSRHLLARKVSSLRGTIHTTLSLWPLMPTGAISYFWGNVCMALRNKHLL